MGDPCAATQTVGNYDLQTHIGAIFILLFTSWMGVAFPIFAKHQGWNSIAFPLQVGKFFGAGVITATGFVHILPDGLAALTNPCLPSFWTTSYPPAGGFFALVAALFIHQVEYLVVQAAKRMADKKQGEQKEIKGEIEIEENAEKTEKAHLETIGHAHAHAHGPDNSHGHSHDTLLLDKKNRISLYILEAAIAIHSIIIGADLGVVGKEFQTLLIALIFHQFFEGMGLGYRISEIKYDDLRKSFANALVYSITTPLGVAIGIGIHHATSPNSTPGIITEGILDSLAAGVLIYTSLVSLISEEFGSTAFNKQSAAKRATCFGSLYLGAAIMSLIGFWA